MKPRMGDTSATFRSRWDINNSRKREFIKSLPNLNYHIIDSQNVEEVSDEDADILKSFYDQLYKGLDEYDWEALRVERQYDWGARELLEHSVVGGLIFVVKLGDEMVGYSHVSNHAFEETMYINTFFVKPEHRNLGIGSTFMDHISKTLNETYGVNYLTLDVYEKNTKAWKLYERLGYKQVRREMILNL